MNSCNEHRIVDKYLRLKLLTYAEDRNQPKGRGIWGKKIREGESNEKTDGVTTSARLN